MLSKIEMRLTNKKNCLHCFILIAYLNDIMMQFSYPARKSSRDSFTIYKDRKIDDSSSITETHTDYIECITSCYNKEKCKSIDVEVKDNTTLNCRFFKDDFPTTKHAEGFLFIPTKPPNCSLSCSLGMKPCGNCECYPSCAARNRRQHVCNCTKAAGLAKSCQEHYNNGFNKTGVYQISPNGSTLQTICEMEKVEQENPTVTSQCNTNYLRSSTQLVYNSLLSYCVLKCATYPGIDTVFFPSNGCFCGKYLGWTFYIYGSSSELNTQTNTYYCSIGPSSKSCTLSSGTFYDYILYNKYYYVGYPTWDTCVSFCVDYQEKNSTQNGYVASAIATDNYGDCQCLYGFSGQTTSFSSACVFFEILPLQSLSKIQDASSCASGWIQNENYCYSFQQTAKNWINSHLSCLKYGGNLLSVANNVENSFIVNQFENDANKNKRFWIGLYDLTNRRYSQRFAWSDNTNLQFTYWRSGEPNNHKGNEHCVEASSNRWNDASCDTQLGFICKVKIVPAADPVGQKLIKGSLNATLSLLEKTYSVSFKIKPISYSPGFKSVIHLTVGQDMNQYGDRSPAVFFLNDESGRLYISSAVNENKNYVIITQPLTLNKWSSVKISQYQTNGIYMYTIYLNELLVHSVTNTRPQSFSNVKVYTADPWYDTQDGFINDLEIISGDSGVWIPMMTRFADWESDFWRKSYEAYENGFGLVNQQWIGLKNIYQITNTFFTDMRVDYILKENITFSTMYYNVTVGSSEDKYVFSYLMYDSRGSNEPDRFGANGAPFENCTNWWTTSCETSSSPTSSYISYGSNENLVAISFYLRTHEIIGDEFN